MSNLKNFTRISTAVATGFLIGIFVGVGIPLLLEDDESSYYSYEQNPSVLSPNPVDFYDYDRSQRIYQQSPCFAVTVEQDSSVWQAVDRYTWDRGYEPTPDQTREGMILEYVNIARAQAGSDLNLVQPGFVAKVGECEMPPPLTPKRSDSDDYPSLPGAGWAEITTPPEPPVVDISPHSPTQPMQPESVSEGQP
ncbi:hypothetical protein A3C39_06125 [Candidatus Saccharibacteria bacterium RIFCSPHIGHO2_02_FULL_46_12]|nr:MAG: hypothetical protein A3C39_06125 [Candidatus Saccharibacteria bacterium RIFCSPHIGHO2_02_FULL_46_12]